MMNQQELLEFYIQTTAEIADTIRKKNQDYSGEAGHAFNNFTHVETLGITSVEQGFLVRMTDKLARISNIVKSGNTAVKSESVEDTLKDLSAYCIIMMAYLQSKDWKRP